MKTTIKKLSATGLACTLFTVAGNVEAFKPAYDSHGHTMITRAVLGGPVYSFGTLSGQPLIVPRFKFSYLATGVESWARSEAIEHITLGVQSRDWVGADFFANPLDNCNDQGGTYSIRPSARRNPVMVRATGVKCRLIWISADLDDEHGHFDNDTFRGSTKAIYENVRKSLDLAEEARRLTSESERGLQQEHVVASRIFLGKAIHTLQDFYAHSTWSDTRTLDELMLPLTDAILSAGELSSSTLAQFAKRVPEKGSGALHADGGDAVGDACLASTFTWKAGQTWQNNDGNFAVVADGPVSSAAWWASSSAALYSQYSAASDRPNEVRCDHGITDDSGSNEAYISFSKFSGVAKDMPAWPLNPQPRGVVSGSSVLRSDDYSTEYICSEPSCDYLNSYNWTRAIWPSGVNTAKDRAAADATTQHLKSSYQAAKHTRVLLERYVELLRQPYASLNLPDAADEVLALVFGSAVASGSTQAWIVDRSATMADVIEGVKTSIDSNLQSGSAYVLVDYVAGSNPNDSPDITVTRGDAGKIRARMAQWVAKGGAGCTTPTWQAVQKAVEASAKGATLYIITDASASDAAQEVSVTAAAQAKQIKLVKLISGSCSPLDSSYQTGTTQTGGSLKLIEHGEVSVGGALSTAIAQEEARRTIHTEAASLSGARTVAFPVETGATRLLIQASGALNSVSVVQPSGAPLVAGAGVVVSEVLNGWNFSITNPQQGNWRIDLDGSGSYALNSYVAAPIDFADVESTSVLKVGRPGHEYRPQLAATSQTGRVWIKTRIVDAKSPVTLDLLRLDGSVISSFPLTAMTTDYFEGEATLPSEAHRFRVRGLSSNNTSFARIHGQGNVAPAVAIPGRTIASLSTSPTWRAGTVNAFAINLKNLGGDDNVSLSPGALPTGASLACTPSSVALPGSEQVNVLCSINLPEAPDRSNFSVVVSSTTAVPVTFQTVTIPLTPLKLPLSCALDIDGDNRVDPSVDGVLLTRYLLGFRGDALVGGLTIPGPRKTDALLSAFFGNAAQFDLVGRASPAPTAMVDGLLMTRLMLGFDNVALLSGINIPAGAHYTTPAAIKENVINRCAGGF